MRKFIVRNRKLVNEIAAWTVLLVFAVGFANVLMYGLDKSIM